MLMFSVNPRGSNPKSPTALPSKAAGEFRKGKAVLFAIMTVDEVDAARAGAAFALKVPFTTGEGMNA